MNPHLSRHPTISRHHLETLAAGSHDESAKWLSYIIQEAWPYAANIVQLTLMEYVQPALEAAIPAGLPIPRFTRIDIGDDAIRIERVNVNERKYSATDICPVLEADIIYDGNPHIEMCLGGNIAFGVQDAKVIGRIEVLFRPLLFRIPLVGAVQVAFINRPHIDYTLTGLAVVGNQSLIRGTVKSVVEDVLASIIVLPNRVAYKLAPDTDYLHFVAKPLGILRVAVICGTGFPSTDRNVFKQAVGQSELPDVYITLRHGCKSFATERVDDSADPKWENQIFDFVLTTESSSQLLEIEAYDYDLGTDDFLGRANVLVSELVQLGTNHVDLEDSPEEAVPVVKIAAKWLPLSTNLRKVQNALLEQRDDKNRPKNCSSLLLSIDIDEAKNLPSKKRPYVRIRVGDLRFSTHAAYDMPGMFTVEDPEFEQSFHVPLEGPVDAGLRIVYQILDLYTGTMMGHAYGSLGEAIQAGDEGKVYTFALVQAERADASLRLRVRIAAVLDQPPLWQELSNQDASPDKQPAEDLE